MNELQMQNIGGIDYHLKDQYARDIIATSENGLDSQSNLPVASRPYVIGEYLIDQNRLYYEVIDTISTGDVLVVGSNIKRTTVSSELNKLKANSAIAAIEIVAPIEDTLLSAREYQADDPLYWINEHLSGLYEATMHIVVGDALVIGTNIKPAKKIANSVKDINDEISDMTGILGAKNLCPNNASTVTQSGVTYTVNTDGSVKITGTATANNALTLGTITLPKGTYKITTGQTQEQNASQLLFVQRTSDNTVIGRSSDNVGGALGEFTVNSDTEVRFSLWSDNGRTGVVTLYPMCRPVTIKDGSYVPHVPTNRELDLRDKELSSQISNLASIYTYNNPTNILTSNAPVISAYAVKQDRIANISLVFSDYRLVQGDWTILGTLTPKFRPAIQQNFNAVSNTDGRSLQARIEPNGSVRIWVPSAITHASLISLTYFTNNNDH